jgi:hypothetical protein
MCGVLQLKMAPIIAGDCRLHTPEKIISTLFRLWSVGRQSGHNPCKQASVSAKSRPTQPSPPPRQLFSRQFADYFLPLAHNQFIVSFKTCPGQHEIAGQELKAQSAKKNTRNPFAVYSM